VSPRGPFVLFFENKNISIEFVIVDTYSPPTNLTTRKKNVHGKVNQQLPA